MTTSGGPIFIGGLDRSGKTLMRLALSAHPAIALTRRTYFWQRFYLRYGDLGKEENFERCLDAMMKQKSIRLLQPDPQRIRAEFNLGAKTYPHLFALFYQHFAGRMGKTRWGEQSGLIEEFAAEIFAAYPAARLIHMVRDPRNRSEEILQSAPPKFRTGKIGAMTASWLHSAKLAHDNQLRYPEQVKVVQYEDLLRRPVETLKSVCSFIGEQFTPEMISLETSIGFGSNDDTSPTPAALWTSEIIEFSLDRLRCLTRRENAFLQAYASQPMGEFGYALQKVDLSTAEKVQYFVDWPVNIARMVSWRALENGKSS